MVFKLSSASKIKINMSGCGKRNYDTENLALEALIEAIIRFPESTVTNVYQCDDCGNWHLTSRGAKHPYLIENLENGYIKRQRQALEWKGKLGYN